MASMFNTTRLAAASVTFCAALAAPCAALCSTVVTPSNSATPEIQVDSTDQIYGSYSGSVMFGAAGAAATLSWQSAGYYWGGDIGLTNALGTIVAEITTNYDDTYHLYAEGSGFAALGTTCVAGSNTACVVLSGTEQSLLPVINSLNGGNGICCGTSNLVIMGSASDVPEPGSMLLAGTAIAGLLGSSRRRFVGASAKA